MRRLISMLAAGLLAAGTILTTVGAASAGASTRQGCTPNGQAYLQFTSSHGVNYYVATPNSTFSGATVRLKLNTNSTDLWMGSTCSDGSLLITNRGFALTSRAASPGGDVTVETPGVGGSGYASQHWFFTCADSSCFTIMLQNVKTGLSLRIRNSGPSNGQTLTTGNSATVWTQVIPSGSSRGSSLSRR